METSKTSATSPTSGKSRRKWIVTGVVAAVVLVAVATVLIAGAGGAGDVLSDYPATTVTQGELIVSIVETGEVRAQKKTIIANNMRWEAVIVERVEEGTHVDVGDLIIKFECQELLEAIQRTELEVTAAENEHQQALEQIDLSEKEWINRVAQAEAEVQNQQNNVLKFQEHEKRQLLAEAESQHALAQQDLELAEGQLKFKKDVNSTPGLEGTYSLSTIKAEELRVQRLRLAVDNAAAEVEKLKKYELPREETSLSLALQTAELDLERAYTQAKAQRRIVLANEQAKRSALEMKKRRLEDLIAQRELLEIRAEAPGVIVYDSGNRWDPPDLSVGALVRSRRRLMRIPDMSTLRVYSKVFEGVSEKVQVGMPVTIRLDSRGDEVLNGRVASIAPLASSEDRRFNPNVKVFPIEISLDEVPEGLKPGSSAQIELTLNRLPDVTSVKIAAVFTEQDRTYVWRVEDGLAYRTEVAIGEMSNTHVQILSGLAAGDTVLMAPPPDEVAITPDDWIIEQPVDEAIVTAEPDELMPPAPAAPAADETQPRAERPRGEARRNPAERPSREGRPRGAGGRGGPRTARPDR